MVYRIRPFRREDAEALAQLAVRAIRTIGPRAYSPEQVAAWSARHGQAASYVKRSDEGHLILVCVDDTDSPCAYALLEGDGHLDHLYCDPDHTRQGVAENLLAEAETAARASGATRLYTEASELACAAFERAGYRVSQRRDFEVDGVPIHNYAMEKALA